MTANATSASAEAPIPALLAAWYGEHGRHTRPWRLTRDPYAVLVSEVMLQQTQVNRVRPYYERWIARWPNFAALAAASPTQVIQEWAGLGYNRRALHLHRLAAAVMEQHGGELPALPAELLALPGIGPYTASAIACFARSERVTVADTNIARVVARASLGLELRKLAAPGAMRAAAAALLPADNARDHNLALMDLGAMICSPRKPECEACPLRERCAWRTGGYPRSERGPSAAVRFEETARFARGRIVAALRDAHALSAEALAAKLPERHAARLSGYLFALSRDGMVEQHEDGRWALPGRVREG